MEFRRDLPGGSASLALRTREPVVMAKPSSPRQETTGQESTRHDTAAGDAARDAAQDIAARVCVRVRELRAQRKWSLEQLAQQSGVSRSMLSQIEREQANPTLAVTLRIAQAFELSLGELVEAAAAPRPIDVIRAGDQQSLYRSDDVCEIRTLSPLHLEKDVELYEVRLQPKKTLHSAAHFEGTREFLTVQQGKVRVQSGESSELLSRGDSASYRADIAHAIENRGRSQAIVLLVVVYA